MLFPFSRYHTFPMERPAIWHPFILSTLPLHSVLFSRAVRIYGLKSFVDSRIGLPQFSSSASSSSSYSSGSSSSPNQPNVCLSSKPSWQCHQVREGQDVYFAALPFASFPTSLSYSSMLHTHNAITYKTTINPYATIKDLEGARKCFAR